VYPKATSLDVALDRNFASNHRIFFVYMRIIDADNCVQAVDSATLDEDAGTLSNVHTIFQGTPFTNRAVSQTGSRIAIDPKDGTYSSLLGTDQPAIRFRCRRSNPTSTWAR